MHSVCYLLSSAFKKFIKFDLYQKKKGGTSLVVQWLRLHTSSAGGMGSIPGRGTKILHVVQCGQKKKKKNFDL